MAVFVREKWGGEQIPLLRHGMSAFSEQQRKNTFDWIQKWGPIFLIHFITKWLAESRCRDPPLPPPLISHAKLVLEKNRNNVDRESAPLLVRPVIGQKVCINLRVQ